MWWWLLLLPRQLRSLRLFGPSPRLRARAHERRRQRRSEQAAQRLKGSRKIQTARGREFEPAKLPRLRSDAASTCCRVLAVRRGDLRRRSACRWAFKCTDGRRERANVKQGEVAANEHGAWQRGAGGGFKSVLPAVSRIIRQAQRPRVDAEPEDLDDGAAASVTSADAQGYKDRSEGKWLATGRPGLPSANAALPDAVAELPAARCAAARWNGRQKPDLRVISCYLRGGALFNPNPKPCSTM